MKKSTFDRVQQSAAPVVFKKTAGLFGATTLGVGAMLGAGLYVLIGVAAEEAGPLLWASFAVCGLLTLLTVFVFAQFARRKSASGGGYFYAYDQLGSFWGFMVGWHLAVGSAFACALYAHGFASYIFSLVSDSPQGPWTVKLTSGALVLFLLLLVLRGGRGGGLLNKFFTWGNVAILAAVAAMGFLAFSTDNYEAPVPKGFGGVGAAISLIYISFFGFQLVANNSEEIQDAQKNVPRAMLLALGVAFSVYLVVVIAAIGAVGHRGLGSSDAPLVLVAVKSLGRPGVFLIGLGGILASAAALNSTLIAQGRQIYAMGRDGLLPKLLGAVTRKKDLPAAALTMGGMAAFLAAVLGDVTFIAKSANFALIFAMMPVCVALHVLFRRSEELPSRWHRLLPWAALAANGALLVTLDIQSLMFGGLVTGAGCAVFLAYSRSAEERGRSGFSVSLEGRAPAFPLLTGSNSILVPLGNPQTIEPLFTIARSVLPAKTGEIVALSVTTGNEGTQPRVMLQDRGLTEPALKAVEQISALAKKTGTKIRPVIRAAKSLSRGIRHAAIEENCSLIVMGWSGRESGPSDVLVDVVTKSRKDFVFLNMMEQRPFQRIGVALGGTDNLVLMAQIAAMLAEQCAGEVSYFNVLPTHFSAEDLTHSKNLQRTAIQNHAGVSKFHTELFTTNNPFEAIVDRTKSLDLLLIGFAPLQDGHEDSLVGSFSTMIIEQAHCSVIIVRRTPGFGRFIPQFVADMFTFESP